MDVIKERLIKKGEPIAKELKEIIANHGTKKVGDVTLAQSLTGMKGVISLLTLTSKLDPEEGIRFRGYSIPELRTRLPKKNHGDEPLPEGLFYLMLMDEIPSKEDVVAIGQDWSKRAQNMPRHVYDVIDALPKATHPMVQFSTAILAASTESKFRKAYSEGLDKKDYWDPTYEGVMDLLAYLPLIAAYIYRRVYHHENYIDLDPTLDWSANLAHMMGFDSKEIQRLFRLYLFIHADHEGGNVSAHATHLVGSTLSDPYYAFSAGMNGLAGPLHGMANQEVMQWIYQLIGSVGNEHPTKDQIAAFIKKTLNEGKVIPGYGHAVLRKTDPRFEAQRKFAQEYCPDAPLIKIVNNIYEIVPPILNSLGKVKNPWPNVDAHSGALLETFGIKEHGIYTVLFGVSRALGVLTQHVWDRILQLPIERPKSQTLEWVREFIKS